MSGLKLAPPHRDVVRARVEALDAAHWTKRLWEHDPTLWSDDPAHQAVANNRLGWLDVATAMAKHSAELAAFASEVASEGYTHAILLGMGGSSLAPEVLRLTFGVGPGALDLAVLDSTSPAAVRAATEGRDPAKTLFVVSSKSGGTIEVASFEAHMYEWVRAARGEQAGRSFVAITDPGTSLGKLAAERGYRKVFENPPDIGGRYSALSYFGLVPAALLGIDVPALLDHAAVEMRKNQASVPAADQPGLTLGAALGELAVRGRDKLTLVLGREIAAFGSWIEQLVAESTGKQGKGIVPIVGEPLSTPDAYGDDRVFVAISVDPLPSHVHGMLDVLRHSGHPVLECRARSTVGLGAEFLRWEIATAVASSILGVDAFDEPNVTEAKQATQRALERWSSDGRLPSLDPIAARDGRRVEVFPPIAERLRARVTQPDQPAAWAAALPSLIGPGDYFAVLAYLHARPEIERRLEKLRLAVRGAARAATTVGYGPRFLHSTGQLHKGGPNRGVFMQLTADEGADLPIPGRAYGFGTLIAAQAWGDFEVLARHDRRALRVHLGSDPAGALDEIIEALDAARV